MKKAYSILWMFVALFMMFFSSCSDSMDEYKAGEPVAGQGIFFPTSTVSSYETDGANGSITVKVGRTIVGENNEVEVKAIVPEGSESLFEIPATITFEADKLECDFTIKYKNLTRGTEYKVTVSFPGNETMYSKSSLDFNIIWPNEVVYVWEVVSENAVLIDNMFAEFGAKDISISDLKVEKAKDYDIYRLQSPYDNSYFQYLFGSDVFTESFVAPYIVLDGEKFKAENGTMWFIDKTALGFKMINGEGPRYDTEWNTFGSVAGNLQTADGPIEPGDPKFPLGVYDEKTKSFDLGATYHNLDGENGGYIVHNQGTFKLYLDPALMTPDYDRDYTWNDVEESEGEYISELDGVNVIKSIQQAEEDETFYRIPDLFAAGYPLYFKLDKEAGTVSIPKEIPIETGMSVIGGNKVYVKGVSGESSYDAEKNIIKLGLSFYLADEEGNEIMELATSNDIFVWGKTGFELFEPGAAIEKYVGNWSTTIITKDGDLNTKATIIKNNDNTLSVSGILGISGYDDTFKLNYISNTGLLKFTKQYVAEYNGYKMFVTMANDKYIYASDSNNLIGGISIIDGNLKFINDENNDDIWSYFTYATDTEQGIMTLDGFIELDWSPVKSETKTTSLKINKPMIFRPSEADEFKVKLYNPKKSDSSRFSLKVSDDALRISNLISIN